MLRRCGQNLVRNELYTAPFLLGIAPIESHRFPFSIGVIYIETGSVHNSLRTQIVVTVSQHTQHSATRLTLN